MLYFSRDCVYMQVELPRLSATVCYMCYAMHSHSLTTNAKKLEKILCSPTDRPNRPERSRIYLFTFVSVFVFTFYHHFFCFFQFFENECNSLFRLIRVCVCIELIFSIIINIIFVRIRRRRRRSSSDVMRRKKLILRIMLRVNIFFMLFEKLLYVTKELLLVVFSIDFSPSTKQIRIWKGKDVTWFFFCCFSISFNVDKSFYWNLQNLIYSMDQIREFLFVSLLFLLRHDKEFFFFCCWQFEFFFSHLFFVFLMKNCEDFKLWDFHSSLMPSISCLVDAKKKNFNSALLSRWQAKA